MEISLYPNPSVTHFTLDLPKQLWYTEFIIELYSVDGKLLKKGEKKEATMHIEDLNPGSYLVNIKTDNGSWNATLIKE
jgi:hypothetical protein